MNRIAFLLLLICSNQLFSQQQILDANVFVINIDDNWVEKSVDNKPAPTQGYVGLYNDLSFKILQSSQVMQTSKTGYWYISFEIDTTGDPRKVTLEQDICETCGTEVLDIVSQALGKWVPAEIDGVIYPSKFILPIKYALANRSTDQVSQVELNHLPSAKYLRELVLVSTGIAIEMDGRAMSSLNDLFSFNDLQQALDNASMVRNLDLSWKQIEELPSNITSLTNLRWLNVRNNELTALPVEIDRLSKLTELLLDNNNLSNLPEKIQSLKMLSNLSLTHNNFNEFPLEVTEIKSLRVLDMSDNNISAIPPAIGKMKKLRVLALINNNITSLPEEFFKLRRLEKLYIDPSKLKKEELNNLQKRLPRLEIINE